MRGETLFDLGEKLLFAAEKMRRAGDVEHYPIGSIERGKRRKSAAPIGDVGEALRFSLSIGRKAGKSRHHGARIGEHHAGLEALSCGRGIDGDEPLRILDLGDRGEPAGRRLSLCASAG